MQVPQENLVKLQINESSISMVIQVHPRRKTKPMPTTSINGLLITKTMNSKRCSHGRGTPVDNVHSH